MAKPWSMLSSAAARFWKSCKNVRKSFQNFRKDAWSQPHFKETFLFLVVAWIFPLPIWAIGCFITLSAVAKLALGVAPLAFLLLFGVYHYRVEIFHLRKPSQKPQPDVATVTGTDSPGGFLKRFWQHKLKYALVLLLLWILLVNRVEHFGWFDHLQDTFLDIFARGRGHSIPRDIFIVEITDDDYKNKDLFDQRSPLKPALILQLINKISAAHPQVIGVDLDTGNPSWDWDEKDKKDPELLNAINQEATAIIWADVPKPIEPGLEQPNVTLNCVLGTRQDHPRIRLSQIGIVSFPQDADGAVRGLVPSYKLSNERPPCFDWDGKDVVDVQSFSKAVSDAFSSETPSQTRWGKITSGIGSVYRFITGWLYRPIKWLCHHVYKGFCASERKTYFRFSGDRYSFQTVQASEFLGQPELKLDLLNKKIVLIGGSYTAARDEYWTPFGKVAGVELIANAIESNLQTTIQSAPAWLLWIADLIAGIVIVLFYYSWSESPGIALVASCLAILALFGLAWIFYHWASLALNVAPIMAGMVAHEMSEGSAEHASLAITHH